METMRCLCGKTVREGGEKRGLLAPHRPKATGESRKVRKGKWCLVPSVLGKARDRSEILVTA